MDSNHTCLEIITLYSTFNKGGNYYSQAFLKKCKYIDKKVIRHNINDIESSDDDSTEEYVFFFQKQFSKYIFWRSTFKNISEMYRLVLKK